MPDYVYAVHDFEPEHEDEINFKGGERIEVLERDDQYSDGWWQVSVLDWALLAVLRGRGGWRIAQAPAAAYSKFTRAAAAAPPRSTSMLIRFHATGSQRRRSHGPLPAILHVPEPA
ncbi:hypothetical protein EXIGLDRAFT_780139 [Exidia glandulosa HHB12029]|uniref:SH3 domain-containing protein n=1 Tax=Exidia glandulosa HHB12029 TaxID=1314781 RepID=A0A165BRB0_EXIGL|nr:hypothetical protein EXIGLDRAFT_780139 [Exidia glandulosa HHB12029]